MPARSAHALPQTVNRDGQAARAGLGCLPFCLLHLYTHMRGGEEKRRIFKEGRRLEKGAIVENWRNSVRSDCWW